jgi:uncharacterized protein (DUF927 family)
LTPITNIIPLGGVFQDGNLAKCPQTSPKEKVLNRKLLKRKTQVKRLQQKVKKLVDVKKWLNTLEICRGISSWMSLDTYIHHFFQI